MGRCYLEIQRSLAYGPAYPDELIQLYALECRSYGVLHVVLRRIRRRFGSSWFFDTGGNGRRRFEPAGGGCTGRAGKDGGGRAGSGWIESSWRENGRDPHGAGRGRKIQSLDQTHLPPAGVEMYYYDQLGCNNSDVPDDASLWTIQRYVEEVEEVRRGLGHEQFVLYGHSCGGIFALEYALKYQRHLRGLVISNMAASIDSYLKHVIAWKSVLAPASRARLDVDHRCEIR